MPIRDEFWHEISQSEFPHEREGLSWIREHLPDNRGLVAFTNFEFNAGTSSHEVDLAVIGPGGLVLVELKHWWQVQQDSGHTFRSSGTSLPSPFRTINKKAKLFKGRIDEILRDKKSPLKVFVSALVCFTHPEVRFRPSRYEADRIGLCTIRADLGGYDIINAILDPTTAKVGGKRLDAGAIQQILSILGKNFGLDRRRRSRQIQEWTLDTLVGTSPLSEDWIARRGEEWRCIRVFPTKGSTEADRDRHKSLAKRERKNLDRLRHPAIERALDFIDDAERGPAIIMDDARGFFPIDDGLQRNRSRIDDNARWGILDQLLGAIGHAHSEGIIHRALGPGAVAIKVLNDGQLTLRIGRWSTARKPIVTAADAVTTLQSVEAVDPEDGPFLAPEVHKGEVWDESADVFSIGALTYLIWTSELPPSVESGDRSGEPQLDHDGIPLVESLQKLPGPLRDVIRKCTRPDRSQRYQSIEDLRAAFGSARDPESEVPPPVNAEIPVEASQPVAEPERPTPVDSAAPAEARPPHPPRQTRTERVRGASSSPPAQAQPAADSKAIGVPGPSSKAPEACAKSVPPVEKPSPDSLTLLGVVGEGGTGKVVQARRGDGRKVAVKIAHGPLESPDVLREFELLQTLDHAGIIRATRRRQINGCAAFEMELVSGSSLKGLIRAKSRLAPGECAEFADAIFDILAALESAGVWHGDLKPEHFLTTGESDFPLRLIDFSSGGRIGAIKGGISRGTPGYLDPSGALGPVADRYAAAAIIHECISGQTPVLLDSEGSWDSPDVKPPALPRLASDLRVLEEFFKIALQRDPAARHASLDEMRKHWQSRIPLMAGGGISLEPVAATSPSAKATLPQRVPLQPGGPEGMRTRILTVGAIACTPRDFRKVVIREKNRARRFGQALLFEPKPDNTGVLSVGLRTAIAVVEQILCRGPVIPLTSPVLKAVDDLVMEIGESDLGMLASVPATLPASLEWATDTESIRALVGLLQEAAGHPTGVPWLIRNLDLKFVTGMDSDAGEIGALAFVPPSGSPAIIEIDEDEPGDERSSRAALHQRIIAANWRLHRIPMAEIDSGQGPAIEAVRQLVSESIQAVGGASGEGEAGDSLPGVRDVIATRVAQIQIALLHQINRLRGHEQLAVGVGWERLIRYESGRNLVDAIIRDLDELVASIGKLHGCAEELPRLVPAEDFESSDVVCIVDGGTPRERGENCWIADLPLPLGPRHLPKRPIAIAGQTEIRPCEDSCRRVLRRIWGHDDFREGQWAALERALNGQDTIVLLPTGAGKSLVFQLAAILRGGAGLVISPLVALMNDQVENLKSFGVRAAAIHSQVHRDDQQWLIEALGQSEVALLYVSPERLQSDSFRKSIRSIAYRQPISVAAIDEAHCVSEWGHDFRTGYLNVARTCREITSNRGRSAPILALTGTASRAVLRDVQRELCIVDPDSVVTPESFDRQELQFGVMRCRSGDKRGALEACLEDIARDFGLGGAVDLPDLGVGLVFCPYVNSPYGILAQQGAVSQCVGGQWGIYSGKRPKRLEISESQWEDEKQRNARLFREGKLAGLVTTKSFGMGIDKENVRFTVHINLPSSIESFYQEAGRAGRDRQGAQCRILLSDERIREDRRLVDPSESLEVVRALVERTDFGRRDDVFRNMWFQTQSYAGVEIESDHVADVLRTIGDLEAKVVHLPWVGDEGKQPLEKSVHRLLTVGVIRDYTVNYAKSRIEADLSGADKMAIAKSMYEYAANFSHRLANRCFGPLKASADDPSVSLADQALMAAKALTIFIYEHVERSRRQAQAEMYRVAQTGVDDPEQMRARIIEYLSASRFSGQIEELIEAGNRDVAEQPDGGLGVVFEIVEAVGAIDAGHVRGEAGRALESYPEHAALRLLRGLVELRVAKVDERALATEVASAIGFARRDGVREVDIRKMLEPAVAAAAARDHEERGETGYSRVVLGAFLQSDPEPRQTARFLCLSRRDDVRQTARGWLTHRLREQLISDILRFEGGRTSPSDPAAGARA